MYIKLPKYKIFLRKGALPPCNPHQGASPLDPNGHLAQALGLLASLKKGHEFMHPRKHSVCSLCSKKGTNLCIFSLQNLAAPLQPPNHIFL